MADLDDLDRQIVALLQEDARLSNRAIAARLHSSEPTVRRRMERLVDEGLVRIVAVASPFALGHKTIAIIGLQIDRSQQHAIERSLVALPDVHFVGLTLGGYDVIIEVWLPSAEALLDFLTREIGALPGVLRAEPWQVVKLSKYSYDWGEQPSATVLYSSST
jgi:Lrp/AsnC family transcriptional regulator for asnA, asnC and gidA